MTKTRTYTKEADVKAEVKRLLDKHGWFWWMPPANGFGRSGISDFNAIRKGVFLVIETKFGNNSPTTMQVGYMNSVQAEDGFAFVVNEKTLSSLQVWLEAFDRAVQAATTGARPTDADGAAMLDAIHAMTKLL